MPFCMHFDCIELVQCRTHFSMGFNWKGLPCSLLSCPSIVPIVYLGYLTHKKTLVIVLGYTITNFLCINNQHVPLFPDILHARELLLDLFQDVTRKTSVIENTLGIWRKRLYLCSAWNEHFHCIKMYYKGSFKCMFNFLGLMKPP